MKRRKSCILFSVLMILLGIISVSPAISSLVTSVVIKSAGRISTATTVPTAYKSEIRGVFFHSATWNDPSKVDWDLIAQTLQGYGINVIVGEFLGLGGGYYGDSNYGDQLGKAISAFHARNIEVHTSHTLFYSAGRPELHAEKHDGTVWPYWICPTKQGTRNLVKQVLTEVMTNYDLDGYMFDYIRYDVVDMCYCTECRTAFQQWLGETITDWTVFYPGGSRHGEFMEWRVTQITSFVKEMREWILAIKPDLTISVASFTLFGDSPAYWRYFLGQDTADWVNKGYLDFVAPMMYTTNLGNIQDYIQTDFKYMVGGSEGKIPLVAFVTTGLPEWESPADPAAFKAAIDKVRELGADGWIIWRYGGPGTDPATSGPDIRNYLDLIDLPDVFSVENVRVSPSDTFATVTWTTRLPATSKVEYSTSPLFSATFKYSPSASFHYWDVDNVPGLIVRDDSSVTSHELTLVDLTPGTKYYFRVQSEDRSGIATSRVLTFTTKS